MVNAGGGPYDEIKPDSAYRRITFADGEFAWSSRTAGGAHNQVGAVL